MQPPMVGAQKLQAMWLRTSFIPLCFHTIPPPDQNDLPLWIGKRGPTYELPDSKDSIYIYIYSTKISAVWWEEHLIILNDLTAQSQALTHSQRLSACNEVYHQITIHRKAADQGPKQIQWKKRHKTPDQRAWGKSWTNANPCKCIPKRGNGGNENIVSKWRWRWRWMMMMMMMMRRRRRRRMILSERRFCLSCVAL